MAGKGKSDLPRSRYFIKEDYELCEMTASEKSNRETVYWADPLRVRKNFYYQYHAYAVARDLAKKHRLKSVLDLGCGPAKKLMTLISPVVENVAGVDQPSVAEFCRRNYSRADFFAQNLDASPQFLGRTFDLILAIDVIEHLAHPERLFGWIRSHAHAKTWVIFSTPERDLLRGADCRISPKSEHVREWNQSEFCDFLRDEGFEIAKTKLVPPMRCDYSRKYFAARFLHPAGFRSLQVVICRPGPNEEG